MYWGYFAYLPPTDLGFSQIDKFESIFSTIGRVIR